MKQRIFLLGFLSSVLSLLFMAVAGDLILRQSIAKESATYLTREIELLAEKIDGLVQKSQAAESEAKDEPGSSGVPPAAKDEPGMSGVSPAAKDEPGIAGVPPAAKDEPGISGVPPAQDIEALINSYRCGRLGYAWIIDKKGTILYYPRSQALLNPYHKLLDQSQVAPRLNHGIPLRLMTFQDKVRDAFVLYDEIPSLSAWLVLSLPAEEMSAPLRGFEIGIVAVLFIFLAVAFIASVVLSGRIYVPIQNLRDYAAAVSGGDESAAYPADAEREFEDIAKIIKNLSGGDDKRALVELSSLTGLPGNTDLQKELFERIDSGEKFAVSFCDANNMSAYNKKYGFDKGDSVIRFMSMIITNKVKEFGNRKDSVYHIGADHFVFITSIDRADQICKEILKSFDEQIPFYYDEEDRKRGFVLSVDRKGNPQKFDIMTLSIGVATNEKRPLIHPLQIGHIAMEIRDFIRSEKKSSFMKDRRISDREDSPSKIEPEPADKRAETPAEPIPRTSVESTEPKTSIDAGEKRSEEVKDENISNQKQG